MTLPLQSSNALKPRNEALCNTGFFEHYLEYRCTEIGDISDEGQKTGLTEGQAGATDSLLSKLQLGDVTEGDGTKDNDREERPSDDW